MLYQEEHFNSKDVMELIELIYQATIKEETETLEYLSNPLEKAKTEGVIQGARIGLLIISSLRKGKNPDAALAFFKGKLKSAIYSLLEAESKYEKFKEPYLKKEILYYDSLINSLQILEVKLLILVNENKIKGEF